MLAFVTAVTFFLLCFTAYSKANLTSLSEPNFEIGLMEMAEPGRILFPDSSIIF